MLAVIHDVFEYRFNESHRIIVREFIEVESVVASFDIRMRGK